MIEILVALAILGILIIPIGSVVSSIINVNKKAQDSLKVAQLMNDMVEYARNVGMDEKKLDEYAKQLSASSNDYNFEYDFHATGEENESSNINGIDNSKSDAILSIDDNGKLKVDKGNSDKNIIVAITNDELQLSDTKNKINIDAIYTNDKLIYMLKYNDSKFGTVEVKPSLDINKKNSNFAEWAINLENGKNHYPINIFIDGVYTDIGKKNLAFEINTFTGIKTYKSICFRYTENDSTKNSNINVISQTPYITVLSTVIKKEDSSLDQGSSNLEYSNESVIKTNIKISYKNGKVIKEQIYYFTKRLK